MYSYDEFHLVLTGVACFGIGYLGGVFHCYKKAQTAIVQAKHLVDEYREIAHAMADELHKLGVTTIRRDPK